MAPTPKHIKIPIYKKNKRGGVDVAAKRLKCQAPGCKKPSRASGHCSVHRKRILCSSKGCRGLEYMGGKCRHHRLFVKRKDVSGSEKVSASPLQAIKNPELCDQPLKQYAFQPAARQITHCSNTLEVSRNQERRDQLQTVPMQSMPVTGAEEVKQPTKATKRKEDPPLKEIFEHILWQNSLADKILDKSKLIAKKAKENETDELLEVAQTELLNDILMQSIMAKDMIEQSMVDAKATNGSYSSIRESQHELLRLVLIQNSLAATLLKQSVTNSTSAKAKQLANPGANETSSPLLRQIQLLEHVLLENSQATEMLNKGTSAITEDRNLAVLAGANGYSLVQADQTPHLNHVLLQNSPATCTQPLGGVMLQHLLATGMTPLVLDTPFVLAQQPLSLNLGAPNICLEGLGLNMMNCVGIGPSLVSGSVGANMFY